MKKFNKKSLVLLIAVALLLTISVSGTVAYLVADSGPVINTFTPTEVNVDITDTIDGTVKKNVVITNTGKIDAYIRAAIVGYWCNEADEIVAAWDPNDDEQGSFDKLPGDNWVQIGDYYYYTLPVEPDTTTETSLFTSYTVRTAPVEGAHLVMKILVQAIQAQPTSVVQDEWGVTVNGTTITN